MEQEQFEQFRKEQQLKDDKTWGALVHLGGIIGQVLIPGVGNIIGALILWLIRRNESSFVDQQGKEAMNFQITISLIQVAITIINGLQWGIWTFGRVMNGENIFNPAAFGYRFFSLVGVLQLLWLLNVIFSIIAAVTANRGTHYRYPLSLRLVK